MGLLTIKPTNINHRYHQPLMLPNLVIIFVLWFDPMLYAWGSLLCFKLTGPGRHLRLKILSVELPDIQPQVGRAAPSLLQKRPNAFGSTNRRTSAAGPQWRENHCGSPDSSNHSLYLIKLFNSSYPEGNFGRNQLLDGSVSLSPHAASKTQKTSDMHIIYSARTPSENCFNQLHVIGFHWVVYSQMLETGIFRVPTKSPYRYEQFMKIHIPVTFGTSMLGKLSWIILNLNSTCGVTSCGLVARRIHGIKMWSTSWRDNSIIAVAPLRKYLAPFRFVTS